MVRLITTVIAVSLGSSFQFGFATGSLNNLEQIVPLTLAEAGNPINVTMWALINSCFSIGGLIGSYGCVAPLAFYGRKKTLCLANVFVFLSSAFMYYGTVWWVLVLGRISIGIVAGVAQMVRRMHASVASPGRVSSAEPRALPRAVPLPTILAPSWRTLTLLRSPLSVLWRRSPALT